ncbi:uncharacterized protein EMH_0055010 [Eimeria mitis]|uniref:16S rRNA (uracil(1498)-N(3))-methyltransferase n=1 Tax=Eimeria mitis TaxID=44415 RepID=U6K6N6_9EIME|nr:uncharacterized protein EMH_0055010 [Eimeria mitis]CDJ33634.1 hypothetical protein, conserved [Eimeria mitis]
MNLILLLKEDIAIVNGEAVAALTGRKHRHCQQVLKVKVGARVRVGVANGGVGEAEVISFDQEKTKIKLLQRIDLMAAEVPSCGVELDILLAMTRPKVLERILQLCAVVGVRRIFLVCAERTEKGFFSSSRLAAENLLEQLVLGLEQGMVTTPPELHAFASWEGFMAATNAAAAKAAAEGAAGAAATAAAAAGTAAAGAETETAESETKDAAARGSEGADPFSHYLLPPLRLVAHPHTQATLPQLLLRPAAEAATQQQQQKQQQRTGVLLAVGPEGGWVPSEMQLLQQQLRCLPFRLTDKVLKCEAALTACITQLTLCYEDPVLTPLLRSPDEVYKAAAAAAAAAVADDVGNGDAAEAAAQPREVPRRQGERETLRAPGGFLMTFPRRYTTRRDIPQQQQQQQEEHESS